MHYNLIRIVRVVEFELRSILPTQQDGKCTPDCCSQEPRALPPQLPVGGLSPQEGQGISIFSSCSHLSDTEAKFGASVDETWGFTSAWPSRRFSPEYGAAKNTGAPVISLGWLGSDSMLGESSKKELTVLFPTSTNEHSAPKVEALLRETCCCSFPLLPPKA